jgi:hypothetical protein
VGVEEVACRIEDESKKNKAREEASDHDIEHAFLAEAVG